MRVLRQTASRRDNLKTEISIPSEQLTENLREWLVEHHHQADQPQMKVLADAFADGWGACMNSTMRPATSLAMILLKFEEISLARGATKVMLDGEALTHIMDVCRSIIGQPREGQIDALVEAVELPAQPSHIQRVHFEADVDLPWRFVDHGGRALGLCVEADLQVEGETVDAALQESVDQVHAYLTDCLPPTATNISTVHLGWMLPDDEAETDLFDESSSTEE